ncbi:MAG TPA: hypothetical protein VGR62_07215 [Candidatus Binatia bacterium]|jgi:hypothetical protein|nr:hypothetical protein [Candidatus Binatia bacterium]
MLDISGSQYDSRPAPLTVTIHDVRVVVATEHALIVERGGRRVAVPRASVRDGSTALRDDDHGTLILPVPIACSLGLP